MEQRVGVVVDGVKVPLNINNIGDSERTFDNEAHFSQIEAK